MLRIFSGDRKIGFIKFRILTFQFSVLIRFRSFLGFLGFVEAPVGVFSFFLTIEAKENSLKSFLKDSGLELKGFRSTHQRWVILSVENGKQLDFGKEELSDFDKPKVWVHIHTGPTGFSLSKECKINTSCWIPVTSCRHVNQ